MSRPKLRGLVNIAAGAMLLSACGGIPIWPAPTESTSAAPAVAAASAAPDAKASTSVLPPHVSTRAGVVVVAVGPIAYTLDDSGARKFTSGGEVFNATHALAKQLYSVPRLRPHSDETTVSTLAGAPVDATSSGALHEIAELRAALTPELDGVSAHALLESLARKVDVEGLVVVATAEGGATNARLVRVETSEDGDIKARLDGAIFQATSGPPATVGDPPSYSWNATSIASLLGPTPVTANGPTEPQTPVAPVGPRRDALATTKAKAPPPKPKSKSDEKKSKTIFESPWFWVAAGAVAAVGVTALVVSQTVNTTSGNVRVEGKVLP